VLKAWQAILDSSQPSAIQKDHPSHGRTVGEDQVEQWANDLNAAHALIRDLLIEVEVLGPEWIRQKTVARWVESYGEQGAYCGEEVELGRGFDTSDHSDPASPPDAGRAISFSLGGASPQLDLPSSRERHPLTAPAPGGRNDVRMRFDLVRAGAKGAPGQ
jgi:hypothetical protein